MALVCALANNPQVQKRAQAELDAVVGTDRLPRIEDRPALPYLNAVMKELTRWFSPAPLGKYHLWRSSDSAEMCLQPYPTRQWKTKSMMAISYQKARRCSPMFGKFHNLVSVDITRSEVWYRSIMHDPEIFERPFEFSPERYLEEGEADPAVIDPEALIFGFGRR